MFIPDAAHQFLQDVLQCDDARHVSGAVHHHRQVNLVSFEATQLPVDFRVHCSKFGRSHDFLKRSGGIVFKKLEKILGVNEADDVVGGFSLHRKPCETRLQNGVDGLPLKAPEYSGFSFEIPES